jgi:hypothetical protein
MLETLVASYYREASDGQKVRGVVPLRMKDLGSFSSWNHDYVV